jgi:uncharacterized protein
MPEYVTPGVFVDETPLYPPSITGVATSTCAFVGPTLAGPVGRVSETLSSFADYTASYGGMDKLVFAGDANALYSRNYMAHAVQAFFDNGGARLHVVRVAFDAQEYGAALQALDAVDDISTVAAPGYSALAGYDGGVLYRAIESALLAHVADHRRFRFAVLDSPPHASMADIQTVRRRMDSSHAALYYPWVVVANPLADRDRTEAAEVAIAPSGHVCGVYARVDTDRGVHKAPGNEPMVGVLGLEKNGGHSEQEVLSPLGINCLRFFPARGYRIWGARTVSNDTDYKYISVRRYLNYLERSISRGLQWAAFEPNAQALWTQTTAMVTNFLLQEWRNGSLVGNTLKESFFVRCDQSIMTQSDLDDGRLVVIVGVAMLKPAEFTLFRFSGLTASATT